MTDYPLLIMRILILEFGFLVLSVFFFGPIFSQTKEITYHIVEDIDQDGKIDSVIIIKSTDNASEYYDIRFSMGNKKIVKNILGEYSYSSFVCILALPGEIQIKSKVFIQKLSQSLFELRYKEPADSAIAWYIDVINNQGKLEEDGVVEFKSSFKIRWQGDIPETKRGFTTIVDNINASNIVGRLVEDSGGNKVDYKKYMLAYFANNHKKIDCDSAPVKSDAEICITNHGVFLKRNNNYAWLLINDAPLTGFGSDKLRWPSVKAAKLYGKYVVATLFSNASGSNALYIIDITSGRIARLSNRHLGGKSVEQFEVVRNELLIKFSNKTSKILLDTLF